VDTTTALAILTDALDRCRDEDMRTPDVFAALDFLATRATVQWPLNSSVRSYLATPVLTFGEAEGRWQVLNASLNGIKLAVTGARPEATRRKREWVFEPPAKRKG
jgi:hypothetical protein